MAKLKYVIGYLVVIVLCTVIWFHRPEKEQMNQLEEQVNALKEQVGSHYRNDISSLENTATQFLAHNFNQPITDEDEGLINELSEEFRTISHNLFFTYSNPSIHSEWQNRVSDVRMYLPDYLFGNSLTKEEIADLYQALQAIRFITMDFKELVPYDPQSSYDAMHDEEHEMVERIKYRLSLKY